ncbi:hypothetical protein RRG08_037161 [Elysia crispata]|uniref:G8 domain-containing protein n=1 Tax=Elysia crispata TaxID=231223 RepID=A0AAE1A6B0_9GAST|nr:hypothetical protein RRG08_037161 [Elysia crispata]
MRRCCQQYCHPIAAILPSELIEHETVLSAVLSSDSGDITIGIGDIATPNLILADHFEEPRTEQRQPRQDSVFNVGRSSYILNTLALFAAKGVTSSGQAGIAFKRKQKYSASAMKTPPSPVVFLVAMVTLTPLSAVESGCPWESPDLKPWSEANSWPSGVVPQVNSSVIVVSGMKILLDSQIPRVTSITIEAGGVLVWGDVDGVTVETTFILVLGELHIGAEDCRFEKRGEILLYGESYVFYLSLCKRCFDDTS